jgi:hypothetical protein
LPSPEEAQLATAHPSRRLAEIDEAIAAWAQAEVAKVDGIRGMWRYLDTMQDAAQAEAECQHQRALSFRRRLEALKSAVLLAMQMRPWPEGKPRKLEGQTGSIAIRGNGGKEPVIITDEEMLPDEYCTVTATFRADQWRNLCMFLGTAPPPDLADITASNVKRAPSLSLIGAALKGPCPECGGTNPPTPCPQCGGSGYAGVPGAALGPRGEHVTCR